MRFVVWAPMTEDAPSDQPGGPAARHLVEAVCVEAAAERYAARCHEEEPFDAIDVLVADENGRITQWRVEACELVEFTARVAGRQLEVLA
jgi:hypothetical protein